MTTTGIQDIFDEQARINKKKRNLSVRDDQTAADWLELAQEYHEIDSRANYAYCTNKAAYLGGVVAGKEIEHKEEWWNK